MGKGMKKVFLHGALGKRFKKEWEFAVDSPSEVVSALFANEPKIEKYLIQKEKEGIEYGIKKQEKGNFIIPEDFELNTNSDIHIFPIPKGSSVSMLFMAVSTFASAYVSTKMQEAMQRDDRALQAQTKSYLYNGQENRYEQGSTVPLGYGRLKVGSNVISSSIVNYDYNSEQGKIFNFTSGLSSLIPEYSKYYVSQLGPLGSSFLLNYFDGKSQFNAIAPNFSFLQDKVDNNLVFSIRNALYGDSNLTLDQKAEKVAVLGGLGGYLEYKPKALNGVDIQNLGANVDGFNWWLESQVSDESYTYMVTRKDATKSSFVALQSVPTLETENEKTFYPITFAGENDTFHKKNSTTPPLVDGQYPIEVGERWKNGDKKQGVGWFKLESASIYKSIDLVAEGPIEGFSDKDGATLKFSKEAQTSASDSPVRYDGDDYLQAVNLNEVPVKEILNKGQSSAQDSYNINEFDIDIAQNKDGDIGSNNQNILEPQYLFTSITKDINKPLFGPRAFFETVSSGDFTEFVKDRRYEKGTKLRHQDIEYVVTRGLNNELKEKQKFVQGNIYYITDSNNNDLTKFYAAQNKFTEFEGLDFSKSNYSEGDLVQKTNDQEHNYYQFTSEAQKYKGIFDDTKVYDSNDFVTDQFEGIYEITGGSPGEGLTGRAKNLIETYQSTTSDGRTVTKARSAAYILTQSGILESKNEEVIKTENEQYWKEEQITPGEENLGVFEVFNLESAQKNQQVLKGGEEYYLSHTVINPLVEEVNVSLQVDELGYVYGGDEVEVRFKVGAMMGALIAIFLQAEQLEAGVKEALAKVGITWGSSSMDAATKIGASSTSSSDEVEAKSKWGTFAALTVLGAAIGEMMEFKIGTKNENSGELWPNRAKFRIKYGNEGELMYSTDIYIYGVATAPYRKDVKIYLPYNPSAKRRNIKVYKLNQELNPVIQGEVAIKYKEKMSLASVTEIVPTVLNYPNSVVIGTRVNARDVPSIPSRNYDLKLKKVAIPSNYNPETKRYNSETWNGLFLGQASKTDKVADSKKHWTDNPAWCLYDLISDKRYGVGKFGIKSENIDRWTLYRIAKYCDEEVPTGYSSKFPKREFTVSGEKKIKVSGIDSTEFTKEFLHVGKKIALFYNNKQESIQIKSVDTSTNEITLELDPVETSGECAVSIDYPLVEPRYTVNALLMSPQNAFKLINEFAQIFRSYVYWAGGVVNFFQDEKKDSVMLFANNNTSSEGFVYSSTPRTSRTNSCKIQYLDKYNDFISKMECSEDTQSIRDNNIIEQKIDGFGVTSPGQAKRAADFLVKSANLETEIVSFKTSSIGSYLRPGDIIDVVDNKRTVGRFAGKVLDITISGDGKAAEIDVDFPVRTIIDENDKSTWKNINLYTITGNQTIESLDSAGEVKESDIKNMRASQVGQYLASNISNNDTKIKIINNPYSFVTGKFSWTEALRDAEGRGGMLATVNNNTDQSQVQAVLPSDKLGWIGGYNQELPSPEKFVWQQPQACDSDEITYFNWADGFPKVGSPMETDSEDNVITDLNDLNITTDSVDGYGNYIAVSGSESSSVHGDWVTLSGNQGIGYVLEKKANDSLLKLNEIEGTTFSLEDSVNFAEPKTYRVININEESPGKFQIQGVQYNKSKFDNIENDASLQEPKNPVIFTEAKLDPPSSIAISIVESNNSYGLKADWSSVVGAIRYRVQFFNGNELLATFELENNSSQETQSFTYRGKDIIEGQNYYVRIHPLVV